MNAHWGEKDHSYRKMDATQVPKLSTTGHSFTTALLAWKVCMLVCKGQTQFGTSDLLPHTYSWPPPCFHAS